MGYVRKQKKRKKGARNSQFYSQISNNFFVVGRGFKHPLNNSNSCMGMSWKVSPFDKSHAAQPACTVHKTPNPQCAQKKGEAPAFAQNSERARQWKKKLNINNSYSMSLQMTDSIIYKVLVRRWWERVRVDLCHCLGD